jgi:hypothetical protein
VAGSQPASASGKSGGTYADAKGTVRLDLPAGWNKKPNKDYDLFLVPAGAKGDDQSISLDIPDLPAHVPGMIPLGMVAKGYLDDLRKTAGVAIQTKQEPQTLPKAQARLLTSTWQRDEKSFCDTALVIVHSDHVYILRAACDAAQEKPTREAFDAVAHSLQWTK